MQTPIQSVHVRLVRSLTPIILGVVTSFALLFSFSLPTLAKPLQQDLAPQQAFTDTITITLWYAYAAQSKEEEALSQVILTTKSNFSNTIIHAERKSFDDIFHFYEAAVRSGEGPDLLLAPNDSLGDHARAELVKDLTADLAGRLTNVYTNAIEGMKVDGKIYGVPESAKAVALYYDLTAVPTPPTTTAQLLSMVKSGKKIAINTGRDGGYYNFGFYGAFGGQLLDANGKCIADQGGFVPAMQFLVDLKNAGAIIKSNSLEASNLFMTGQVDMLIDGPWRLFDYRSGRGNFSVAPMPSGPNGAATPLNGIDGFYINPNTKQYKRSLDIALFMTNQQSSQQFTSNAGHVPIRLDVSAGNDDLVAAFAQASATGYPRPQSQEFSNYWDIFGKMFTDVLSGTVTPEAGVRTATQQLNSANGFATIYLPLIKR